MKHLPLLIIALLLVACARMGRPDGGWYDETPPRVVGAMPQEGAVRQAPKKVRILFDEYIKIENATEKVVISPPQLEAPDIKAQGKSIVVALKDTLKPDITYTIDFSDAITDFNENNPLGNYTYAFSTGGAIDTLQVAGTVLQAADLEPVKGILVGLYAAGDSAFCDSTFIKEPLLRVSRTDSRGHFVVKGVAPGAYRVVALQDMDGDYRYSQRAEMLAFDTILYRPAFGPAIRQDTLWRDSLRIRDIVQTPYTRFTPDDIVLRAFTARADDRYFLKAERPQPETFTLYFSAPHDSLPALDGLDFDARGKLLCLPAQRRDTVTYWLTDTALCQRDTLTIAMHYWRTDTAGVLEHATDTLELLNKQTRAERDKTLKKEYETWKKRQERARKRDEPYDTVMPARAIVMEYTRGSYLAPDRNIHFRFGAPLATADPTKIHLYARHDSLWYNARCLLRDAKERHPFRPEPADTLTMHHRDYELAAAWRPGVEYSLEIDSLAFHDLYGHTNHPEKAGFKVPDTDEYATVMWTIAQADTLPVVVQMLDQQDNVLKETGTDRGKANFFYVTPGTYYFRAFIDRNRDGLWDTGDYATGQQPEPVFYYPEKIECRAKWDVIETWRLDQRPLDRQKPDAIKKQKAEKQKKIQQRNRKRAEDLGIEYYGDPRA